MNTEHYLLIARQEETHFWHKVRREIIREALLRHLAPSAERRILDVGCGPGGNILVLGDFGRVTGLDIAELPLSFAATRGFAELKQASAEALPFPDASFDLVSGFDVFEHVIDDERAFAEASRVLRPGGLIVLTVPAHRWLWSRHDEAYAHMRRYAGSDLFDKLAAAGFRTAESSHFMMPAVPAHLLRKAVDAVIPPPEHAPSYDFIPPAPVNAALTALLRIEKRLMRAVPLPFGSSLLVVARKH